MENPIKMDDLGGKPTIFGNILIGMPYIGGTISSPHLCHADEIQKIQRLTWGPHFSMAMVGPGARGSWGPGVVVVWEDFLHSGNKRHGGFRFDGLRFEGYMYFSEIFGI